MVFQEIYNSTRYTLENTEKLNRRIRNCFFKAFKKRQADRGNNRKENTEKMIIIKVIDSPICSILCFDEFTIKNWMI